VSTSEIFLFNIFNIFLHVDFLKSCQINSCCGFLGYVIIPHNLVDGYQYFGGIYCLLLQSYILIIWSWFHLQNIPASVHTCRSTLRLNIFHVHYKEEPISCYYENYTKHINAFYGKNTVFLLLKQVVHKVTGARGSVVGWHTILPDGRSRVRVPMRSSDFSIYLIFQPHYGPGVDSASNRNEYQDSSWM
jgi:hypothetical protein